jgi:hypothetical protein
LFISKFLNITKSMTTVIISNKLQQPFGKLYYYNQLEQYIRISK